jgi:hypothetical protein
MVSKAYPTIKAIALIGKAQGMVFFIRSLKVPVDHAVSIIEVNKQHRIRKSMSIQENSPPE